MSALKVAAASLFAASVASAAIIDVFVGGSNGLVFTPNQVTANVGDSVRFTFGTKNHTVTQSTFADPCTLMPGGFFSGFMPVAADQVTDLPEFWIPVKDTKPIWAFCSQANHCQQGMVFAVNAPAAPATNDFDNFKAAAMGGSAASGSTYASTSAAPAAAAATTAVADNAAYGAGYGSDYGSGYGSGSGDAGAASSAPSATVSANAAAAVATTGVVHTIVVGGSAGLVYTPNNIQAAPGDVVQFQFQVKNHTVTQSTFKTPCGAEAGGFDSGFMPVAATTTSGFPTYSIMINDTTPIWGYCRQAGHCQQGMVFAINANESSPNTFEAFQTAAKASSASGTASSSAASTSQTSKPTNGAIGVKQAGMGGALFVAVAIGFGILL